MFEWIIVIAVVAVVAFFLLKRSGKPIESKNENIDTYVCDVCGENHCDCRKQEDGE